MKDRTTHEPRVWIQFYARCRRSTCLSVFFLLSPLVPLCIILLSLPFLELIILCPFLPLSFSQRKTTYTPVPQGAGCLLFIPLFFILSPIGPQRKSDKKVNIWTAAKDGRGVASLASASVMSRPETSSSQHRERWFPPYPIMTYRENCPTILMFVTWQPDWECQWKMAACPNRVCLIHISSRLMGEQRF